MKSPKQIIEKNQDNISRKEALKRMSKYSKYTALTAISSFMILNPKKAQALSGEC